jgi:hypothetical protein
LLKVQDSNTMSYFSLIWYENFLCSKWSKNFSLKNSWICCVSGDSFLATTVFRHLCRQMFQWSRKRDGPVLRRVRPTGLDAVLCPESPSSGWKALYRPVYRHEKPIGPYEHVGVARRKLRGFYLPV